MSDETPNTERPIPPFWAASKQSDLSQDEALQMRAAWIGAGLDAATFDAAAARDGLQTGAPPDAAAVAHDAEFSVPSAPDPNLYKPVFRTLANQLSLERLDGLSAATTTWAAEMRFSEGIGNYAIERIAEVGPQYSKMSVDERAAWTAEQNLRGARAAGSPEAWEATKAKAVAALAGENEISVALRSSPVIQDVWLTQTLANHADRLAAWEQTKPRKT